ncbi:MAG TPA: NfeD family protein [Dehalococcoidales bacterium]|nr:NfeD family protein [Dehalococcoidales bacterium]
MNIRLLFAIVSSLLQAVAIVAIIIWVLPRIDVVIPIWGTILIVAGFAVFAVVLYSVSTPAVRQKPMIGFTDMVGTEGIVASLLDPAGLVKIESEIWVAKSETGKIEKGDEVVVTAQKSLLLVVKPKSRQN